MDIYKVLLMKTWMKWCLVWWLTGLPFFSLALAFTPEVQPDLGKITAFKASELCILAEHTQQYLQTQVDDTFAVHAGEIIGQKVNLDRVKQTLAFICQTYRADVRAKRQSRLHDSDFLQKHFTFVRWLPDKARANSIASNSTNKVKVRLLESIPKQQIFVTKYYTKVLKASLTATKLYNQALYAVPFDEQGLSLQQANLKGDQLARFQYSRQQVIAGALLDKKIAKPLVWLTETALHDVLLQGTGVLDVDGKRRFFNVTRNNGIAYDYRLGKTEQARYWYFTEVPGIMGYGHDQESKIMIKPQVTFAGNVAQLGLGKLIMLSYASPEGMVSRMGILADQGGAFDNNLFQLDLLVDSYYGWADYHQANKQLPDYASAWIMLLKHSQSK